MAQKEAQKWCALRLYRCYMMLQKLRLSLLSSHDDDRSHILAAAVPRPGKSVKKIAGPWCYFTNDWKVILFGSWLVGSWENVGKLKYAASLPVECSATLRTMSSLTSQCQQPSSPHGHFTKESHVENLPSVVCSRSRPNVPPAVWSFPFSHGGTPYHHFIIQLLDGDIFHEINQPAGIPHWWKPIISVPEEHHHHHRNILFSGTLDNPPPGPRASEEAMFYDTNGALPRHELQNRDENCEDWWQL